MYEITISELIETQEPLYPKKVSIYEQRVENLDIPKLVTYINSNEPNSK